MYFITQTIARKPRCQENADPPGPQLRRQHRKGHVAIDAQDSGFVMHNALCQSIPEKFALNVTSSIATFGTPVMQVCRAHPELVLIRARQKVVLLNLRVANRVRLNFIFPFSCPASARMKHSRRMTFKGQVLTATAVVGPFSGPLTTYHLWSC